MTIPAEELHTCLIRAGLVDFRAYRTDLERVPRGVRCDLVYSVDDHLIEPAVYAELAASGALPRGRRIAYERGGHARIMRLHAEEITACIRATSCAPVPRL